MSGGVQKPAAEKMDVTSDVLDRCIPATMTPKLSGGAAASDIARQSMRMQTYDDLEAEQDQLESLLQGLDDDQWQAPSAAAGWSVADVVLHLAQTEEAVAATVAAAGAGDVWNRRDRALDDVVDDAVRAERGPGR